MNMLKNSPTLAIEGVVPKVHKNQFEFFLSGTNKPVQPGAHRVPGDPLRPARVPARLQSRAHRVAAHVTESGRRLSAVAS